MLPVIELSHISKSFPWAHGRRLTLKSFFTADRELQERRTRHQVLQDVSFSVPRGQFVGILGRNGSGKSTLLKILSGIYQPDSGNVFVRESLSPFLELGIGFHPDLTARQNMQINAVLLGLTRRQVDKLAAEIIQYAEVSEFMDERIRNFSSGMQMRLAFAIALFAQREILLLDEVLAVGDIAFQQKCLQSLQTLKKNGKTIVLVTHAVEPLLLFADRVIILQQGFVRYDGAVAAGVELYRSMMQTEEPAPV